MLLNLIKSLIWRPTVARPNRPTPTIPVEECKDLLRIVNTNVGYLKASRKTYEAVLNSISPRKKKRLAHFKALLADIDKRIQEETYWQTFYLNTLNVHNEKEFPLNRSKVNELANSSLS